MLLNCEKKNKELITLERIDNYVGHSKENCVLACLGCNLSRNRFYSFNQFYEKMESTKPKIIL